MINKWLKGPLSWQKATVLLLICMLFQGITASIIVLIATSSIWWAAFTGLLTVSIIFILCIAWIVLLVIRSIYASSD